MITTGTVQLAFIGGLGPTELIVIFLIVLLVFGAKRIPEIAQGLGKGIMEFKRAAREITDEIDVKNTSPTNNNYARNELKSAESAPKPQPRPRPRPKQTSTKSKSEAKES